MELEDDLEVEEDIKNIKNLYGKLENLINIKISPKEKVIKENTGTKKKPRMAFSQDEVKDKKLYCINDEAKENKPIIKDKLVHGKNTRNVNVCTLETVQTNYESLNYLTVDSKVTLNQNKRNINKEKINDDKKKVIKEKQEAFDDLYFRSIRQKEKISKRNEEKKKEEEEKRLATLQKAPVINENSKKILAKKDVGEKSFFERLELTKQENEKKRRKMMADQEEKLQKEIEELELKRIRKDKKEISEKVNKLLEWNNKKEMKLKEKKNEIEKEVEKVCTFKPEINKLSEKIAQKEGLISPDKALTERLYEIDVAKRKEKKKILESIYSPTFMPMTNSLIEGKDQNERKKIYKRDDKAKSSGENCLTNENEDIVDDKSEEKDERQYNLKLFTTDCEN